jgi:hypothetical protein
MYAFHNKICSSIEMYILHVDFIVPMSEKLFTF